LLFGSPFACLGAVATERTEHLFVAHFSAPILAIYLEFKLALFFRAGAIKIAVFIGREVHGNPHPIEAFYFAEEYIKHNRCGLPRDGYFFFDFLVIVSTIAVLLRRSASFTEINRPVFASRPILSFLDAIFLSSQGRSETSAK
jgi:hypothetical protein